MGLENYLRGKKGEKIAIDYLNAVGYKIIKKNYHSKRGEIDIVALDKDVLTFIEVKYFSKDNYLHPLEAVGKRKQVHIIHSAKRYYYKNKIQRPCRYDILAIKETGNDKEYTLIKDAFRESRKIH